MFWIVVGIVCGSIVALWVVMYLIRRASIHGQAERGETDAIRERLQRHPELKDALDLEGRTPLYWAARYNHMATLDLLIGAGANLNLGNGWKPLHIAAHSGHADIVGRLLAKGAAPDVVDSFRITPLMEAVRYGHLAVVNLLLDHGADVNSIADEGETALHWAAKANWDRIVDRLIKAGANIEASYRDGWTPLHFAAGEGNAPVVTLLIKAGAAIDPVSSKDGRTPLHRAAKEGHTAAVELLLSHKANVNLRNAYGKTPLYYTKHFPDTKRVLQAAGGV